MEEEQIMCMRDGGPRKLQMEGGRKEEVSAEIWISLVDANMEPDADMSILREE